MKLRAALTAAAMLGLGGALAPGHAEEVAPSLASTPFVAPPPQTIDAALPRFAPSAEPAELLAEPVALAEPETGDLWQPVGRGVASWYGPRFAGRPTASGETFDPAEYTAAHRTLPFGSKVRVTNSAGESVIVRINDRGPFAKGRLIDVSQAAARDLGLVGPGHGPVTLALLEE